MTQNNKINLLQPIIFLVVLALVVFGVVTVLTKLSEARKLGILNTYTSETNSYIGSNQSGLEAIYNDVFTLESCVDYRPGNDKYNSPHCTSYRSKQITELLNQDIKNFSSTAFIKLMPDGQLWHMKLSGEIRYIHERGDNYWKLLELLKGSQETLEIGVYTHTFDYNAQEVVVPVKNGEGKIIGAITRRVIEE